MTAIPRFGLIVVGDEVLSGKRADKHFARVVTMLGARGLRLSWAQVLPDERPALVAALRTSFAGADVVFSCGGIGATPDDHTRQAVAEALGVPLALHPDAATLIGERCAEMGQPDMTTAENRQRLQMGVFPAGATLIPNPYNRIAGFTVRRHHFVPGFPVMAWPMLEWVLDTCYAAHFHAAPQVERALLLFETAESRVVPLMEALERDHPSVRAFSLPSVGDGRDGRPARRHIELGIKGPPEAIETAYAQLAAAVAALGVAHEPLPPVAAPAVAAS
jgi:molybdopterin-biosynthesis enzyme MoeA-like protein